jgi:hypothetical protein
VLGTLTAKEESQIAGKSDTAAGVAKMRENMKKALQKKVATQMTNMENRISKLDDVKRLAELVDHHAELIEEKGREAKMGLTLVGELRHAVTTANQKT